MKREFGKGFAAGLVACALAVGLVSTAFATRGRQTVEADYTDIKIELNGAQLTPTDANGNPVEPFAVNGTTYLPVRAVGNALGLMVGWDGATSTVKLSGRSTDDHEVYLQMLQVMDEYNSLDNIANWGMRDQDYLSDTVSYFLSDSTRRSTARKVLTDALPDIQKEISRIDQKKSSYEKMVTTSKTDSIKMHLENLISLCDTLKTGQQELATAYILGISFLDNNTNRNWDNYFETAQAANDYFRTVREECLTYYDVRDDLMDMLER